MEWGAQPPQLQFGAPRAEHTRAETHPMVGPFRPQMRTARARSAAPEAGAIPISTASFRLSRIYAVEMGSIRLRRVVFGVSPNTPNHHSFCTKQWKKSWCFEVVVETTTTARETRALPVQLHGFGLEGAALHIYTISNSSCSVPPVGRAVRSRLRDALCSRSSTVRLSISKVTSCGIPIPPENNRL